MAPFTRSVRALHVYCADEDNWDVVGCAGRNPNGGAVTMKLRGAPFRYQANLFYDKDFAPTGSVRLHGYYRLSAEFATVQSMCLSFVVEKARQMFVRRIKLWSSHTVDRLLLYPHLWAINYLGFQEYLLTIKE